MEQSVISVLHSTHHPAQVFSKEDTKHVLNPSTTLKINSAEGSTKFW